MREDSSRPQPAFRGEEREHGDAGHGTDKAGCVSEVEGPRAQQQCSSPYDLYGRRQLAVGAWTEEIAVTPLH